MFDLTDIYQRQHSFKFELLNSDLNKIGDLELDGSGVPSISNDTTRAINRTISSVAISDTNIVDINPYTDRVRPTMIAKGKICTLGTYLFSISSSIDRHEKKPLRTGSLVDQLFLVDQPTDSSISLKSSTLVTSAIKQVLGEIGGFEYQIEENVSVIGGGPVSWRSGTSALQIVNDLCKLIGYLPFHFNHAGVGIIRESPDPTATAPTITYNDTEIYTDTFVTDDTLEAPNRYVIVDTASPTPITATYNIPARLPHSYENRGYLVRETLEVQGLGSVTQASLALVAFANWDARQGSASFNSPPNPLHDSYDILMVGGRKYLEMGWTLPLVEGGDMTHSLIPVPL